MAATKKATKKAVVDAPETPVVPREKPTTKTPVEKTEKTLIPKATKARVEAGVGRLTLYLRSLGF